LSKNATPIFPDLGKIFFSTQTPQIWEDIRKIQKIKSNPRISPQNLRHLRTIPKPVWAVGFALEQPLHVVALACSAL
jgi:hypothetical protein